jgi:hypothetical protein
VKINGNHKQRKIYHENFCGHELFFLFVITVRLTIYPVSDTKKFHFRNGEMFYYNQKKWHRTHCLAVENCSKATTSLTNENRFFFRSLPRVDPFRPSNHPHG